MESNNSLPKNWVNVNLDDISEIVTGNTPSKNNPKFYGGNISYFKPTDLNNGFNVINSVDKLSALGLKYARKIPEKSILVTCIGATIGKTGFIRTSGATNQQINSLIPNSSMMIPELLYYWCISLPFQESILKNSSSTTLPIINKSKFSKLVIPLPPLNEQKRIVEKIGEFFSLIESVKKTLEKTEIKLDLYRRSLLKNTFDKITNHVPLSKIAHINPTIEKNKFSDNLDVSFLPMRNVEAMTGNIDVSITKKFREVKKGYTFFEEGDLLFAKITPCMENGKIAIAQGLTNKIGFGSTEFHVIRFDNNEILPKFYFWYLIQDEFRNIAQRSMKGTAGQLRVPTDYLKNSLVPFTSKDKQQKIIIEIDESITKIRKQQELIYLSLQKINLLKQSILKQAFEGKLVPQDPNDESTDLLLKKIKNNKI